MGLVLLPFETITQRVLTVVNDGFLCLNEDEDEEVSIRQTIRFVPEQSGINGLS